MQVCHSNVATLGPTQKKKSDVSQRPRVSTAFASFDRPAPPLEHTLIKLCPALLSFHSPKILQRKELRPLFFSVSLMVTYLLVDIYELIYLVTETTIP